MATAGRTPGERQIFEQALEIASVEERLSYLRGVCGEDAGLFERVQALLRADEAGEAFLPGEPRGVGPANRIGRYALLETIGEGGCGTVYLAEQEEPVRRRVALKLIKLGMDTRQVVARFEGERQALALMDHPNIAKVFDGGATETGRPFFVMELVQGTPITDYCDQNGLSTAERLELFRQVCLAIQHAHQKGIVHRDIKPSNVLVALQDGTPVPKVIDFGIAKATEPQLLTEQTLTAAAQFLGTPAYMSPEQAGMTGRDIDTRSDIYALGVLLYELLTGKTPFDAPDLLKSGVDEMRRIIREQAPLRPLARLTAMEQGQLVTVAARRQVEPPKLIRAVRGDLDWIVMKCLEKDRARRYETATGLAVDIYRHLHNHPVMARPASNSYVLQRWVRRNKLAFAATGAVMTILAAAAILVTMMWLELRGTAPVFFDKAQALVSQQRFEEALAPIRYALQKMPRQPEYWVLKGNILESLLRVDEAKTAYQQALRLKADDVPAQRNLQVCARILRDYQDGRDLPASSLALLHSAMREQGRKGEADALLRRLLALDQVQRTVYYQRWRKQLDQARIGGTLTIDDSGRVELRVTDTPLLDLSALRGIPLNSLDIHDDKLSFTTVKNLSALRGLPLERLRSYHMVGFEDLTPLKGMPLRELELYYYDRGWVTNLTPLAGHASRRPDGCGRWCARRFTTVTRDAAPMARPLGLPQD